MPIGGKATPRANALMIITDQLGRHRRAVADQSQDAAWKEKKSERERAESEMARSDLRVVDRGNGNLKVADQMQMLLNVVVGNLRNYRKIAGKYSCVMYDLTLLSLSNN